MTDWVIYTDLDGTLLDHDTYSFEAARPALDRVRETGTPLVLTSSKTRREIEALRQELGNHHPFISENGGGVFIPKGYPLDPPEDAEETHGYHLIRLGRPKTEIDAAADALAERFDLELFSRLPDRRVAELTGLPSEKASAAKAREFGEVLVFKGSDREAARLGRAIEELGLRWTKGGRFYHLLGENDKGRAVETLTRLYRRRRPGLMTAGLGDAPNDHPLLAAVDRPFLVAGPDGDHRPVDAPGLVRVPGIGPAGWNLAVRKLLVIIQ